MDYQEQAWDDYTKTGKAIVDGERLVGLIYGWEDDVADEGRRSHEFGFYAGFKTSEGRLCDDCNVPEKVFERIFQSVPGIQIDWNAAEAYHYAVLKTGGMTFDQFLSLIKALLEANGFVWF